MAAKKQYKYTGVKKSELNGLITMISDTLAVPRNEVNKVREHFNQYGIKSGRAVRAGNKIVGGLQICYWGHYFGGASVPAGGITFVGVAPEMRRQGAASFLMKECILELYREGMPTSTLYAANEPLYRKAGYERAMEHSIVLLNLKDFDIRNMKSDVIELKSKSTRRLEKIYRKFASATNGNIDRSPQLWKDVVGSRWDGIKSVFIIREDGEDTGYVIVKTEIHKKPWRIHDLAYLTKDAAARILTFLSDHSSMVSQAKFEGSTMDPMLQLIPYSAREIKEQYYCMLRIVSVPGALNARGYPVGVRGVVHLEIEDDIIKQNNGRFVLTVRDGKGRVKKGGDGSIKLDIRTLAQMYTGFMTPSELSIAGKLEATDEACKAAEPVFAGSRPWIRDDF